MTPRRTRRPRGQLVESRALASELGALLERLEIDAVLTDRNGIALATARGSGSHDAGDEVSRRVVELRIHGQALCVSVASATANHTATNASATELTPRQREVLGLLRQGLQNREIAERLGISLHTVRRHVEALLTRLDVPSRAAATVLLNGV